MPDYYQIQPDRLPNDLTERLVAALDAHRHFPVATVLFGVTGRVGEMINLDHENLLMAPLVACFNCGQTDPTKFDEPCTPDPDRV